MELFKNKYLDEVLHLNEGRYQYVEMFILGLVGFLIPFAFGHPQLLIGAVVNAFIIKSALSLPARKALPIIFTPTLGVLARGLLFGPFTIYLVLMMPFIWIGNLVLLYAFKAKLRHNVNYGTTLILGSLAKAGFLYSVAYIMFSASILPEIFLTAMGVLQLTTAILGGLMVYVWYARK